MVGVLEQLDAKAGIAATGFWVLVPGQTAEIRFADGSTVGPFELGVHYGRGCDRAASTKLARWLLAAGLLAGHERTPRGAAFAVRHIGPGQQNRLFQSDLVDPESEIVNDRRRLLDI